MTTKSTDAYASSSAEGRTTNKTNYMENAYLQLPSPHDVAAMLKMSSRMGMETYQETIGRIYDESEESGEDFGHMMGRFLGGID